jgi:nucleotide-binding universal stress UspA family protein
MAPELEEQPGRAIELLVAASDSADLVLVGSRGLHGLKALGSVSERVAHQVRSSVLVVRRAPG